MSTKMALELNKYEAAIVLLSLVHRRETAPPFNDRDRTRLDKLIELLKRKTKTE